MKTSTEQLNAYKEYFKYFVDNKFAFYDLQFTLLEPPITANHLYRNELVRQKGVRVYKNIGVITLPIFESMPYMMTFEQYCEKHNL